MFVAVFAGVGVALGLAMGLALVVVGAASALTDSPWGLVAAGAVLIVGAGVVWAGVVDQVRKPG